MEGTFHQDDLNLSDWQYAIRWHNTSEFKIGETVFLKSNPDQPMIICNIGEETITTVWKNNHNFSQTSVFPPECILQYKYASLLIAKRFIHVCIN